MAFQRGSQINPALGMVDYSPIARGGEAMARGKIAGTQAVAQGAMQGLEGVMKGVEQYQKNKQVAAAATAAFEGAIAANPELLQTISAPEAPPKVAAAFKKLQKGAVDADNATMLAGFAASYVQQKQAAADLAFRDMQARQMGQQAQDSAALAAALAQFQPGNAPEGIARRARPFSAQEFMSGYVKAGGSPRGIEQVDAVVRMMSPQAAKPEDLTAAQRDTEAIIQSKIKAGELNPQDPIAIERFRAEYLARGGRAQPTIQPNQGLGPVTNERGEFAGYAVLNQATGQVNVVKPESDGSGVKPTTATGVNRAVLSGDKFLQLRETLVNDEIALRKLTSYLKNVKDAKQGVGLLADKFATSMKTFLDAGQLTPQQLAAANAEGKLQGLIGSNRLDVLGGGTLTESDALRIISFLGGDASALRNKERVQEAISTIFNEKLNRYQRHVEDYNIQSRNYYGTQGYKEVEPIQIDMSVFEPIKAQASASGPVGQIDQKIAEIEARLEALTRKPGAKK